MRRFKINKKNKGLIMIPATNSKPARIGRYLTNLCLENKYIRHAGWDYYDDSVIIFLDNNKYEQMMINQKEGFITIKAKDTYDTFFSNPIIVLCADLLKDSAKQIAQKIYKELDKIINEGVLIK